jgi:glucose dehydrogenase
MRFAFVCRRAAAAAAVLLVTTIANVGSAQPTTAGASAPAFRARQLAELPRAGWLTNGGNLANQRYSPLTEINRDNVANLRGVWRASLGGSGMVFVGRNDRSHHGARHAKRQTTVGISDRMSA